MTNCSISIIIPAYNVERYLDEALSSVRGQSEFPDELILIDDGSTDQTLKIAESYKFPFIYKVISIENNGQGNARNVGASLAASEYIYYFDSDDILAKDFIKNIKIQIKSSKHPDIILFSGKSFNDEEYQGNRWMDYNRGFSGYFYNRASLLDKGSLEKGLFCSPCLYVSKRVFWGEDALSFGKNYLEDEAIFYPLLFSCQSFCVLDEVFFYRRNRNDSTMTMIVNSKHVQGALNCIETTMALYYSKGFSEREYWHIKKLLEKHCVSYIVIAKASGLKVPYRKILSIIYSVRSINLMAKAPLYIAGVNEFQIVRKVGRTLKKLRYNIQKL